MMERDIRMLSRLRPSISMPILFSLLTLGVTILIKGCRCRSLNSTTISKAGKLDHVFQNDSKTLQVWELIVLPLAALMSFLVSIVLCTGSCFGISRKNDRNKVTEFENPISPEVRSGGGISELDVRALASSEMIVFEPLPSVADIAPNSSVSSLTKQNKSFSVDLKMPDGGLANDWFDEPYSNFSRSNLHYLREVGKGWFGKVIQAEAQDIVPFATKIPVVVKVLKEDSNRTEQMKFLNEVRWNRDSNHGNILKLLGHNIEKVPYLLIMDGCVLSDLKAYLISNVAKSEVLSATGDLLSMILDIAKGLEWLLDSKFVHPDLATRNCQVTSEGRILIGDYGTSPSKYKDDYIFQSGTPISIRWTAPETIFYDSKNNRLQPLMITPESNIWSYGIVIWEICEFGKLPYFELTDKEVASKVIRHKTYTMGPPNLPYLRQKADLFEIMSQCWQFSTTNRPSIKDIVAKLSSLQAEFRLHKDDSMLKDITRASVNSNRNSFFKGKKSVSFYDEKKEASSQFVKEKPPVLPSSLDVLDQNHQSTDPDCEIELDDLSPPISDPLTSFRAFGETDAESFSVQIFDGKSKVRKKEVDFDLDGNFQPPSDAKQAENNESTNGFPVSTQEDNDSPLKSVQTDSLPSLGTFGTESQPPPSSKVTSSSSLSFSSKPPAYNDIIDMTKAQIEPSDQSLVKSISLANPDSECSINRSLNTKANYQASKSSSICKKEENSNAEVDPNHFKNIDCSVINEVTAFNEHKEFPALSHGCIESAQNCDLIHDEMKKSDCSGVILGASESLGLDTFQAVTSMNNDIISPFTRCDGSFLGFSNVEGKDTEASQSANVNDNSELSENSQFSTARFECNLPPHEDLKSTRCWPDDESLKGTFVSDPFFKAVEAARQENDSLVITDLEATDESFQSIIAPTNANGTCISPPLATIAFDLNKENVESENIASPKTPSPLNSTETVTESGSWQVVKGCAENENKSQHEAFTNFKPSEWNQDLTPSRPAIKSPEESSRNYAKGGTSIKKSVSFEMKKVQMVYEYPPLDVEEDTQSTNHDMVEKVVNTLARQKSDVTSPTTRSYIDWDFDDVGGDDGSDENEDFFSWRQTSDRAAQAERKSISDLYRLSNFDEDGSFKFQVRGSAEPFEFSAQDLEDPPDRDKIKMGEMRHAKGRLWLDLSDKGEASFLDDYPHAEPCTAEKQ